MLYGDQDRVPLSLAIKKKNYRFWYEMLNGEKKLSSTMHNILFYDYNRNKKRSFRSLHSFYFTHKEREWTLASVS